LTETAFAEAVTGARSLALALLLTCASCEFPRDIANTTDTIRARGVLRVGIGEAGRGEAALAGRFVDRAAAQLGARPVRSSAPGEVLLARLETSELDLVIGDFAEDSPWLDRVAVIEPLASRRVGKRRIGLSPVARAGENAWIMRLEREVRAMRESR
jgi:hypothetical protein